MKDLANSWKQWDNFERQLSLNLQQLSSESNYPIHWREFMTAMNNISPSSILDIGCGCGCYCGLCKRHYPNSRYFGIDYSEKAIALAGRQWGSNLFAVMDYKGLTKEFVCDYDILHASGFFDVLPDANAALGFILSLQPKRLLIGRIRFTDKESYLREYKAYDEIETCEFYHNRKEFEGIIRNYGYGMRFVGSSVMVEK